MITPLTRSLLLAIHDEQLAQHGGKTGLRHKPALDAVLDISGPGGSANGAGLADDLPRAAAGYALRIVRGQPFAGGNLRTGFVALELALALNGCVLAADDVDATLTLLRLANGDLDAAGFIAWVAAHTRPASSSSWRAAS